MSPRIADGGSFPGTRRFAVQRQLGAGGMGVVYEAFDRERQAVVALKTLRTVSPEAILRLKREFRALQEIQHPNLVNLGELFEEDGLWFFTMELVHGAELLEYLRPGWTASHPLDGLGPDTVMVTQTGLPIEPHGAVGAIASIDSRVGPALFDEARVRDALAQLTQGLLALHGAGKIHRDVKPSNVLVARDGRVVLLDFGLVTQREAVPGMSGTDIVGTVTYMAPEQATGRAVGPEADWYSLGVVLYEALVGAPPFTGHQMGVLMQKRQSTPRRPCTRVENVPADLDELCMALLQIEPQRRPPGAEVLRALGVATPRVDAPLVATTTTQTPLLVGREEELAFLDKALADTREGAQVSVYIHGESGIGKSAIVRAFTHVAAAREEVVVLAGRCYEREAVPYKVMDGIIDALARYMRHLPRHVAALLVPQRASLLLQVFPVLRSVPALADSPRHTVADPQELRTSVFRALRELFSRLCERRTLIMAIDDMQWADADGLALLGALMNPPDAPAFLLVASWRAAREAAAGVRQRLDRLSSDARHLQLSQLGTAAAVALAHQLLIKAGGAAAGGRFDAGLIAREASGHPFFIDELVRHSVLAEHAAGTPESARPRLDEVLWARIERLDAGTRRILELVVVAGTPIAQEIAALAAGLEVAQLAPEIAHLRIVNLVRTTGSRASDTVEPYHDRVRDAVLMHLGPEARVTLHRSLARALEVSGRANPEALVEHYRGARELEKAGQRASEAADASSRALAFDQAARLYQLALELLPGTSTQHLRVKLGDALAGSGRGAEAAKAYLAAVPGASAAEALHLQQRAAQQLLVTGHIDEGVATMRAVLAQEGVPYPKTPARAVLSVVLQQARLRLRGLRFHERDESLIPAADLRRIDACFSAGEGLGLVDHVRSTPFTQRSLLLALEAGEPYRLSRSLALTGLNAAGIGRLARGEYLFRMAEQLASRVDNPHAHAFIMGVRGLADFMQGRFRDSVVRCSQAESLLRERCVGVSFHIQAVRIYACRSLLWLGEYRQVAERLPQLLEEAARRGDRFGATTMQVGVASVIDIAHDEPERAVEGVDAALRRWSPQGFHVQHMDGCISKVAAHLYAGEASRAAKVIEEMWPGLEHSLLLRIQTVRIVGHDLSARTAMASLRATDVQRKSLLAEAERCIRRIERERLPWATALARLLRAGVAQLRGDLEAARTGLEAAAAACDIAEMALHAAVARRCLGELIGGERGQELVRTAEAWMAEQGVKHPGRLSRMLAPAFAAWTA